MTSYSATVPLIVRVTATSLASSLRGYWGDKRPPDEATGALPLPRPLDSLAPVFRAEGVYSDSGAEFSAGYILGPLKLKLQAMIKRKKKLKLKLLAPRRWFLHICTYSVCIMLYVLRTKYLNRESGRCPSHVWTYVCVHMYILRRRIEGKGESQDWSRRSRSRGLSGAAKGQVGHQ